MTVPGDLLIRDVRTPERDQPVAIAIRGGRIDEIGDEPTDWAGPTWEGLGQLALPATVDGHAHLDKTLWGLPWRPHSAGPGLSGLIDNERRQRGTLPPVADRVRALLASYLANGTTRIRSHVDVDADNGTSAVEGVLEAAADFTDLLHVEVVAFPQSGMLIAPGTDRLLDAAVAAGASHVGGIDPASLDRDPVRHVDTIFGIAERHGCGVDIHLHDRGSLGRWEIELILQRTRAAGMHGKVTLSHAFALCDGDPAVDPLLEQIADLEVTLATVAPGNVAPLPFARLRELGIAVVLGQDGIRDLWSPWGDADMLARASLLSWRSGHRMDEDIEHSLHLATVGGAAALGAAGHGIAVGARADLMLVAADAPAHAVVSHPPRSLVVANGIPVSPTDTHADEYGSAPEP